MQKIKKGRYRNIKLKKHTFDENDENHKNEETPTLQDTINLFTNALDFDPPVDKKLLTKIDDEIRQTNPDKVVDARKSQQAKDQLAKIIATTYASELSGDEKVKERQMQYIMAEIVEYGLIDLIIKANPKITDIGWNGAQLTLETNDEKLFVEGTNLGFTAQYVERLIQKYARANNKEFNGSTPIMDGMIVHMRVNAVHEIIAPDGATFSLRITRPSLALNQNNFSAFAPTAVLELLEKIVQTNANIFIAGETGTGKTELQKLLISFIDAREKIIMIEDVRETHAKELFPDKDIYSWITNEFVSISRLIKASLRNNPKWINIAEVRGQEAYELMQAILSGHKVIATLHAVDAFAIPTRFVGMCSMGYEINEELVKGDFMRYGDIGIHIERLEIKDKVIRYLSELVEYTEAGTKIIYAQDYNAITKEFEHSYGELTPKFKKRMLRKGLEFDMAKLQANQAR